MYSKPIKYTQLDYFYSRWKESPDSKGEGKLPGIDKIRPQIFQKHLHKNFQDIRKKLIDGSYRFSKLKAVFVDKGNSKERVICIPTVSDRLVQRLIAFHLCGNVDKKFDRTDLLKVRNGVNFDISETGGTFAAIEKVLERRKSHPWVLKTDICSFFDNIDRDMLFKKIKKALDKKSSLIPLLEQVIHIDIQEQQWVSQLDRLKDCGLSKDIGIRQGMPLSPLLAGFFLREFDIAIKHKTEGTVRYADDIAIFCKSEKECKEIKKFVVDKLDKIGLEIPAEKAKM